MKGTFWSAAVVATAIVLLAFMPVDNNQDPSWKVPDSFLKMENPIEANNSSISKGKALYNQHCKTCHGKEGLGDGPKAAQLETPSGDFTDELFTSQPDGAIFYKTREGRGDMPAFNKKLPYEEDVWHIVNYMRTFE